MTFELFNNNESVFVLGTNTVRVAVKGKQCCRLLKVSCKDLEVYIYLPL